MEFFTFDEHMQFIEGRIVLISSVQVEEGIEEGFIEIILTAGNSFQFFKMDVICLEHLQTVVIVQLYNKQKKCINN